MHKAKNVAAIAAIVASSCLLTLPARAAEILYSTFGPGETHSGTSGLCVSGNSTPGCGPLTDRWVADEFSPGQTDKLGQIDLALTYISGANSSTIELVGDSSGHPGTTVLESWTGVTTSSSNLSLTSLSNPLLMSGQNYWIVAKGNDPTNLTFWWSGLTPGHTDLLSLNDGNTWLDTPNLVLNSMAAFSVVGAAVPEPATWALFILGFGGIGAAMRRQRSRGVALA